MPDLLETAEISENCQTIVDQNRSQVDDTKINGYVTVIKNKGKWNEQVIQKDKPNLLTLDGRDFFHSQDYISTTPLSKGSNAVAVSADSDNPVEADTVLVGEITGGGLVRAQAGDIIHTPSSNVTTIGITFTATQQHLDVHKAALFNDNTPVSGIMTHASEFVADVTLQNGDTLTVTWTLTLG